MVKKNMINQALAEHQKGVVLIVSLVFLVALTAVAAALMQNTTTDVKMSGASQEKALAIQETISEMDRVVYDQVNRVDGTNLFAQPAESFVNPVNLTVTKPAITSGVIGNNSTQANTVSCGRAIKGSSGFDCNFLRITVNRQYGRNNNSNVEVNSGIAQELFPNQ
jgi:Tfp pilus assembly protein PilX